MKISRRAESITPFHVMEIAKAAQERAHATQRSAMPMIFLNMGEPDFITPPLVREAGMRAIRDGLTQYTPATGLPALRERISGWYGDRFGITVEPRRIVVTAGASAALQLACLALIDEGDEILMPDPCYPCNRHFVSAAGGQPVMLATSARQRFQLSAAQVETSWTAATRGVLLASPSNPTGTSIASAELRAIHDVVRQQGGVTMVDEIYLGLSYEAAYGVPSLAISDGQDESLVSINSFSKYFQMTGWRLGWMVVPDALVGVIERLAQNLFICPSAVAQHAALACFEPESLAEYERRRTEFRLRRDFFVPALRRAGLDVQVMPDGAFYAWSDCVDACRRMEVSGSWDLAYALMDRCGIAVTPGRDFGSAQAETHLRFSTASSMAHLQEAARRLHSVLL